MGNIASDLACAPCPVDGYVIISEPAQRAEEAGSSGNSSPPASLLVAPGPLCMEPARGADATTTVTATDAAVESSVHSSSPLADTRSSTPAEVPAPVSARSSDSSFDDSLSRDSCRSSSRSSHISSEASVAEMYDSPNNTQHLVRMLERRLASIGTYLRASIGQRLLISPRQAKQWSQEEVGQLNQLLDLIEATQAKAEQCSGFLSRYHVVEDLLASPGRRSATPAAHIRSGCATPTASSKTAAPAAPAAAAQQPLGPAARAQQLRAKFGPQGAASTAKNEVQSRSSDSSSSRRSSLDSSMTSRAPASPTSPGRRSSTGEGGFSMARTSSSSSISGTGASSANWRSPHGFGCNTRSSNNNSSSSSNASSSIGAWWGSAPPSRDPSSGGATSTLVNTVLSVVSGSSSGGLALPTSTKAAATHLVTSIEGRPQQPMKRQPRTSTAQALPAPCMYYGCNKPLSQLPLAQPKATGWGSWGFGGLGTTSTNSSNNNRNNSNSSSSSSQGGEGSWWGSYLAVAEQQGYATAAGWLLVQGTSSLLSGESAPTPAAAVAAT